MDLYVEMVAMVVMVAIDPVALRRRRTAANFVCAGTGLEPANGLFLTRTITQRAGCESWHLWSARTGRSQILAWRTRSQWSKNDEN